MLIVINEKLNQFQLVTFSLVDSDRFNYNYVDVEINCDDDDDNGKGNDHYNNVKNDVVVVASAAVYCLMLKMILI